MTTNRYAFVNFTGKPYIHYHGIPYNKPENDQAINFNEPERTIIRTNQPNRVITGTVPVNGTDNINNFQNNQNNQNNQNIWPNFVKNNNMYACNASKF